MYENYDSNLVFSFSSGQTKNIVLLYHRRRLLGLGGENHGSLQKDCNRRNGEP